MADGGPRLLLRLPLVPPLYVFITVERPLVFVFMTVGCPHLLTVTAIGASRQQGGGGAVLLPGHVSVSLRNRQPGCRCVPHQQPGPPLQAPTGEYLIAPDIDKHAGQKISWNEDLDHDHGKEI